MYAKKLLMAFCAFAVAFGAEAADFRFEYIDNDDGTVTLTGVSGTVPRTLKVPVQIEGKNVSAVGYGFMSKNQEISSIVISEGVRRIGEKAFCDCHSLESIEIPKSVTEIGDKAFVSSRAAVSGQTTGGMSSLVVSSDSEFFEVVSGVLIDRKKGRAIVACANVRAVSLPEGVTTICDMAFCGCTELKTIQFPVSLMTIEGDKNFGACFSLENVDFHETSLVEVGEQAFALCKNLKTAWFPSTLERIGSYAFSWCDALTRVQFDGPEPIVVQVDKYDPMFPFGDIYVTSDSLDLSSNGAGPFTRHLDKVITYVFPDMGWKDTVAKGEWQGRPIQHVGEPECAYTWEYDAYPDKDLAVLWGCKIGADASGDIVIPDSLGGCRHIIFGEDSFDGRTDITSVTLSAAVRNSDDTPIGYAFFRGCLNLSKFDVAESSTLFSAKDGVLYSKDGKRLVCCPETFASFRIPLGVVVIDPAAFAGCIRLSSITIPSSVTNIGRQAFSGCKGLESITIPSSVVGIGMYAFDDCSSLKTVHVGKDGDIDVVKQMLRESELDIDGVTFDYKADGLSLGEVCYYGQRSTGDAKFDARRVFGDGEFVVVAVYGAKTSTEVKPEIIYSVSGVENFSTPEVWTDEKLLDGVKTAGYEKWPTSIWPAKSPVDGRFWIVVKTKSQEWCGYNRFRVGLKGTDAVTAPLFFSGRVSGPRESDGVCADTKRIVFAGECRALMDQGREGGYEGQYFRRMGMSEATGTFDCLGATRFYSGKPQAAFTATVDEAGTFVLSSSEDNWAVARSDLSVSGGYVVSDIESICDDDKSDFEAACKFGRCNCIRRISVSAASTVTFKHRTQEAVCANRFHFFPRDRKSVAIDALFCRTFHVEGSSGSCEYIPGYVIGSGVYVAGETATFTAVPARGEAFDHWEVVYGKIPSGLDMTNSTLSFKVCDGMCGEMKDEQQIVLRAVWKDRFYRDVLALPVGAATVAGNRLAQDEESVSVTLHPDKGCTLRNWSDGEPDNLSRTIYVDKGTADDLIYAFFDGMPSAGDLPFDVYRVVPGEAVSVDTGLIGYTAKGLPSGLKYDKKTGMITGAAKKPTAAEGVTVKFTKKNEPDAERTIVVGPMPKLSIALEGDTEKCKVKGAGDYLVGKKVSLSATAPKGTAFAGWFADGAPWPNAEESKNAKLSYVMTKADVSLVAKFEKEKMSVGCAGLEGRLFMVGVAGGAGIPLEIETQSGVKSVKVTKLPAGMKYNAKTGLIEGAPTKAGDFTVQIAVTAKSGAVEKKDIAIRVDPLPDWAVGTFEGAVRQIDYDADGNVVFDGEDLHNWYDIVATVSVDTKGKISGKLTFPDKKTFVLKLNALTAVEPGICIAEGDVMVKRQRYAVRAVFGAGSFQFADGVVTMGRCDLSIILQGQPTTCFRTDADRPLVQTFWSRKELKGRALQMGLTAKSGFDVENATGEDVEFSGVVKVSDKGVAKLTCTVNGAKSTASGTLLPVGPDVADGFAASVSIKISRTSFRAVKLLFVPTAEGWVVKAVCW